MSFYDHKDTWLRSDLAPQVAHWESAQENPAVYKWMHRTMRVEKEVILGLGERALRYNRNGETASMWKTDPRGNY